MATSDPIADFLTRIRNSLRARHRFVDMSWSKTKQNLAEIMKEQGLIQGTSTTMDSPSRGTLRVYLKYSDTRRPVIQGLSRVSKPGLRRYVKHDEIPSFFGGLGLSVISTSQGLLEGREAMKRKIGGELICKIW
jgi:small subunit ribosomal protein S8